MGYLFLNSTVKQIESDCEAKQSGILEILMEKAGRAVYENSVFQVKSKNEKIVVLTGSGNNGGDGYVAARLLNENGYNVSVCVYKEPKTELCVKKSKEYKGKIISFGNEAFKGASLLIDAVFGTGFKGEINEETKKIFNAFNSSKSRKIAIDVPSGISADSGNTLSSALKADITVTFIGYKKCHISFPAAENCGKIILDELGIDEDVLSRYENEGTVTDSVIIPKRKKNTHKGSFGTAVLICGSYGMAGAAILSAKAALKSGLGIAKLIIPESIYPIVTAALPEAVCLPVPAFEEKAAEAISSADCVLVGCGLSKDNNAKKWLSYALKFAQKTLIIDADGLNLLSESIDLIKGVKADLILTPHPAEMARLMNVSVKQVEKDRLFYAEQLSRKTGADVVLKGAVSITAYKDGKIYYNASGNSGMAKGGSGDVLSGIITAFASNRERNNGFLKDSVYIHGLAGDIAAKKYGEISMLPSDLTDCLGDAFNLCEG